MKALSKEEIEQIYNLYKTYDNLREVSKLSARSLGIVHKYLSLYSLIKKQNIVRSLNTNDERLIGVYVGYGWVMVRNIKIGMITQLRYAPIGMM